MLSPVLVNPQEILHRLERFQLSDLEHCAWMPPEDRASLAALVSGRREYIFTGRWERRIVGIGGVRAIHPGVAELWTFLSPEARLHPVQLYRTAKRSVTELVERERYRRLHAFAREDHPAHGAFLERLGFELESRHPLLGPDGCTMCVYVLFPQGPMSKFNDKEIVP